MTKHFEKLKDARCYKCGQKANAYNINKLRYECSKCDLIRLFEEKHMYERRRPRC